MKFIYMTLLVCFLVIVAVTAVPIEEGVGGFDDGYETDNYNPQDAQEFFKLKKLKKLLFG